MRGKTNKNQIQYHALFTDAFQTTFRPVGIISAHRIFVSVHSLY